MSTTMRHYSVFTGCLLAFVANAASGCDEKKKEDKPSGETKTQTSQKKDDESKKKAGSPADAMKMPQLPEMKFPSDNPQTDAKVALGHQLFFDERLSVDGSKACYSCHQNENGTGGEKPIAEGPKGKLTRHAPVVWNAGYLPKLYWDGRADSLEAQAKGAWGGGNMGVGKDKLGAKAKEIAAIPGYKKQFDEVFPDEGVTPDTVAKAIAAYERTLVCEDTDYDKYAKGDKDILDAEQKAGLEVFMGKGMCTACHAPPHFSTAYMGAGSFFNVGVGIEGKKEREVDEGRMKVTGEKSDWAAFKPPTLRNVTKSAPYFHDGSVKDLKEAVKFMANGGYDNKNKSSLMVDKKLSDEEIDQIVAFLAALECQTELEEPELP